MYKKCTKCGITKLSTDFHKKYGKPIAVCKECCVSIQHDLYIKNRDKRIIYAHKYNIKNKEIISQKEKEKRKNPEYRLKNIKTCLKNSPHKYTYEQKINRIKLQENKCFICDCEFKNITEAYVDHNHTTGQIRGILCTRCNSGLGFFRDNIKILENAIVYLSNNNDDYLLSQDIINTKPEMAKGE